MIYPIQDHVVEYIRSAHPEVAAGLNPAQWTQIIQMVESMIPIIINFINPPTPHSASVSSVK